MAAAADMLSKNKFVLQSSHDEEDVLSETGIILSAGDIDDMIVEEIKKKNRSKKQRPDTSSSFRSLLWAHGLNGSTIGMQLKYLIATGKVIKEETPKLYEEEKKKKKTKVSASSNDERLLEYQTDLLEQASRHEPTQCFINDGDGNVDVEKAPGEGVPKDEICKRLELLENQVSGVIMKINNAEEERVEIERAKGVLGVMCGVWCGVVCVCVCVRARVCVRVCVYVCV